MDDGKGKFIQASREELLEQKRSMPKAGGIFSVGEKLEIKGSLFKVIKIRPTTIRLKLLKREDL